MSSYPSHFLRNFWIDNKFLISYKHFRIWEVERAVGQERLQMGFSKTVYFTRTQYITPARNSFLVFRNSIYNKFKDNKEPKSIPA